MLRKICTALASFFILTSFATACSLTPDADRFKPATENLPNYQRAFVAKVTGVTKLDEFEGNDYQVQVHKVYKGDVANTITLNSPGHSCGYFGQTGAVMLLFLNAEDSIDEITPRYDFDTVDEALAFADTYLLPPVDPVPTDSQIPADCKVWFDGCNTCQRGSIGGPLACTEMACLRNEGAECRAYFGDDMPMSDTDADQVAGSDQDVAVVSVDSHTVEESDMMEKPAKKNIFDRIGQWLSNLFGGLFN